MVVQSRFPIDVMRLGSAMRLFHALQQASRIAA